VTFIYVGMVSHRVLIILQRNNEQCKTYAFSTFINFFDLSRKYHILTYNNTTASKAFTNHRDWLCEPFFSVYA